MKIKLKLLIVVPGGVHPSGEVEVIPALLTLYRELSKQHDVFIIAMQQHNEHTEYRLLGCQVISLAKVKSRQFLHARRICIGRLKYYSFKPNLIHSFWLGKTTLFASMLSQKYKVPLLASIGGGEPVHLPEISYGGSNSTINRLINRVCIKLANATTCGSEYVQAKALFRWGLKSRVIPLGIDTHFWSLKRIENIGVKQWQILHIASINRVKDPWLLLDVVLGLKQNGLNFHLNWVGEDTLEGAVQQKSRAMGLTQYISFHGFKTQVQLKKIMEKVPQHFIIQTSKYESQGVAIAEACSQGICPVGTNVGWLSDLGIGLSVSPQVKTSLSGDLVEQILLLSSNYKARQVRVDLAQQWIKCCDLAVTVKRFNMQYSELFIYSSTL